MPRNASHQPGRTAADRVHDALRAAILAGDIEIGARLTEEAIAARLGVSRTPVRAALVRLAGDGFVDLVPHVGAVVRGWSRRDAREIFEVRALLEGMGARLAARHAQTDDVTRLGEACERMEWAAEQPDPLPQLSELNRAFHLEILRIGGNERLRAMAGNLMDVGFLIRSYQSFAARDVARSMADHRDLVLAIGSRDEAWAESIMRAHILAASNIFMGTEGKPAKPAAPRGAVDTNCPDK